MCTWQIHLKIKNIIELDYCVLNLIFHDWIHLLLINYFIFTPNTLCVSYLLITRSTKYLLIYSIPHLDLHATTCCHQHTIKWCIGFHISYCWPCINNMYWYSTLNISSYLHRYFTITEQTQCIHILLSEPSHI